MANILQVSNIPVRPDRNMPDGQKTGGIANDEREKDILYYDADLLSIG